jgi:hypothetical protein
MKGFPELKLPPSLFFLMKKVFVTRTSEIRTLEQGLAECFDELAI